MKSQFVYIDSSEQEQLSNLKPTASEKLQHLQRQNYSGQSSPKKHRRCIVHNPHSNLLKQSQYDFLVKNLLSDKISTQMTKQLITKIQDYELAHNIDKRNNNYKYFIQRMEIDQKYRAMQQQKADRLKLENQRKKLVLYRHKSQKQMKKQQDEVKKYIIQKSQKQQMVVNNIKKQVRKLGFERIYNAHKQLQAQIKTKEIKKKHEIESRLNKQKNQILELQEHFEQLKEAKRINKIQQRKVIKELSQKISNQKVALYTKYTKKKVFQV